MSYAGAISDGIRNVYTAAAQRMEAAVEFAKPKCEQAIQKAKDIILKPDDSPSMKKLKITATVLAVVGALSLLAGNGVIGTICLIAAVILGTMAKKGIEPEAGFAMLKQGYIGFVARFSPNQQPVNRTAAVGQESEDDGPSGVPGGLNVRPSPRPAPVRSNALAQVQEGMGQARQAGRQVLEGVRGLVRDFEGLIAAERAAVERASARRRN